MSTCSNMSLTGFLENYLAENQISSKKYFSSYLISAKHAWRQIFRETIFGTQSVWVELKRDDTGTYFDIPKHVERVFSVGTEDSCGLIQTVYYNEQISVIPKPSKSSCSCQACDCGGCGDFEDMTASTRPLFTINGVDYYERKWVKVCKNGDIIEYTESFTKKFNDFVGQSGDYNDDYANDYDNGGNGFANYEIVPITTQKTLCKIDVRKCGCPESSAENLKKINDCCGCYLRVGSYYLNKCCSLFKENINNNGRGEVKMGECGTKMYFFPPQCSSAEFVDPKWLLLNCQTNGEMEGKEIQIPSIAYDAMASTLFYRVIKRNGKYSLGERIEAERLMHKDQNALLVNLNLLSLSFLSNLQDATIKW